MASPKKKLTTPLSTADEARLDDTKPSRVSPTEKTEIFSWEEASRRLHLGARVARTDWEDGELFMRDGGTFHTDRLVDVVKCIMDGGEWYETRPSPFAKTADVAPATPAVDDNSHSVGYHPPGK